jgi:hypothetical protein
MHAGLRQLVEFKNDPVGLINLDRTGNPIAIDEDPSVRPKVPA